MVTKRLSLTDTSIQNLVTARAKSFIHWYIFNEKKLIELPQYYCNNEWHEFSIQFISLTILAYLSSKKYNKPKYLMKT